MVLLASEVMDQTAALLNDTAKQFFTYAAQLPYLSKSNEDLELIMIASGISTNRETSVVVPVLANTTGNIILNLNSIQDMFVPIRLWERAQGSSELFTKMDEKDWTPEVKASTSLSYWTFRGNNIIFPPLSANREVKVDYWRQFAPTIASNSVQEVVMSKTYLAARTAELCARYIGENSDRANELRDNEVSQAQDSLERIYVKISQGNRTRRRKFSRTRTTYTR